MTRVDNKEFISKLSELLETSNTKGSVYLQQKRLTKTGSDPVLHSTKSPYPLVFKASNGTRKSESRKKLSTVVNAEELGDFWVQYTEILKKGSSGLRKKDKKKKKKN